MAGAGIRWMVRRDLPDVLEIERRSFDVPWEESVIPGLLRRKNMIGMVYEAERHEIAGYMVYSLETKAIRLLRLAVHPDHRRLGIGAAMLGRLKTRVQPIEHWTPKRHAILVDVPERWLPAQKFLAECGFRAVCVIRPDEGENGDDLFGFAYLAPDRVNGPSPSPLPWSATPFLPGIEPLPPAF